MATISIRPAAAAEDAPTNMVPPQSPLKPHGASKHASASSGDSETLSTYNCDDSMTQDLSEHTTATIRSKSPPSYSYFQVKQQQEAAPTQQKQEHHYRPPVAAVNVDTRLSSAEVVRQRMRNQEAKITSLLHTTTSHVHDEQGTLLKLVKALEADLKQAQEEKQDLQNQLESKPASDEDTAETSLAELQAELKEKNRALEKLENRLETTLQRLVDTQLDLETHNLHYTDYAKVQFETGQSAMEDMQELAASKDKSTRKLGKRSKQMLTTLLTDLEALGRRYQQQHLEHEASVAELTEQQAYWKHRSESLQEQLEACGQEVPDDDMEPPAASTTSKTHEQVAAQEAVTKLQQQLEIAQTEMQQAQIGQQAMQSEVKRLQKALGQLQNVTVKQQQELEAVQTQKNQKKGFFGRFGRKKKNTLNQSDASREFIQAALAPIQEESNRFDRVQARFESFAAQVSQIRKKEALKTAQMKNELATLRLKGVKESSTKETEMEIKLAMAEAKLAESEAQRNQEQKDAQAAQAKLEARILELESTC